MQRDGTIEDAAQQKKLVDVHRFHSDITVICVYVVDTIPVCGFVCVGYVSCLFVTLNFDRFLQYLHSSLFTSVYFDCSCVVDCNPFQTIITSRMSPAITKQRPRLIPHTFTIKHAKRKFHAQRSERTWWQWCQEYRGWLIVVAACVGVALVLYIRYCDRERRVKRLEQEKSRVHNQTM